MKSKWNPFLVRLLQFCAAGLSFLLLFLLGLILVWVLMFLWNLLVFGA